jgi:hypothetical protein
MRISAIATVVTSVFAPSDLEGAAPICLVSAISFVQNDVHVRVRRGRSGQLRHRCSLESQPPRISGTVLTGKQCPKCGVRVS